MPNKFFINPFATSGNKEAIPENNQANGSVSYPVGYSSNYELALGQEAGALPIERTKFNQLMYDVTVNLQDYQIYCFPPYITAAMNGGSAYAYPVGGTCRYNDGTGLKAYACILANNTRVPSISGVVQTGWVKIIDPGNMVFKNDLASTSVLGIVQLATQAQANAGTPANVALTPAIRASQSAYGIARLATDAEAGAGTRSDVAVTPSQLKYAAPDIYIDPTNTSSWMKLGGKLLIQWGLVSNLANVDAQVSVTYAVPYPNINYSVLTTHYTNSQLGANMEGTGINHPVRTTGFSRHVWMISYFSWLTIGPLV